MSNVSSVPTMFLTCQVNIDRTEAERVIRQMESQGFKTHYSKGDVHFTYNGEVNIYTALYMPLDVGEPCYLMVRPHVDKKEDE